jgi:hypothetical protein
MIIDRIRAPLSRVERELLSGITGRRVRTSENEYAFGRHAAAATLHCGFPLALPLLILTYGRRIGRHWAGIGGALLF